MWKGNDRIFKTYVKGKSSGSGKRPAEKVKDRDHISDYEDVESCDCFGGILNPGIIDISFDDKEMYEAFLQMAEDNEWKCLALPSSKGGHTYWRSSRRYLKNGADKKLAVGLVADLHSGSTYIPLKVHGECRYPPDYDILEDEDYQEVPEELLPVGTTVNLWQMQDGEGRNQEIFRYIQRLQAAYHFSQEVITRILSNANEYVLADPLALSELDTITRDEAFEKPVFFNGKTFLFDEFAVWLMNEHHVVTISGQLHIYKDGVYVPGSSYIERTMIEEIPNLRKAQRKEVMEYMILKAEKVSMADARYIAFKNGVLDMVDKKMLPFTPERYVTNQIPWDYIPSAYDETADKMLDRIACHDPDVRALLEECIGYCFFRRNELRKAFILTGGKRGGKSTYLDCIKAILGNENVSSLDLKEVGDRFSTAMMAGKLANIGDDISDDFLMGSQVAMFKKVVAGNRIKAERKGYDPFDFDPYVKLLFSANEIPRMRDRGNAVLDRLIIIPFNAVFDKSDPDYDPFLKYKVVEQKSVQYMIRLGVDGLIRVLHQAGFTQAAVVRQRMQEYEEENNPMLAFLKDVDVDADILNEPTGDVYRRYTVFCQENGLSAIGKTVFSRQLCSMLGIESVQKKIGGKNTRIYLKQ